MTDIIVHDTLSLLKPFFTSREHPKVVFEKAQDPLFGEGSLFRRGQAVTDESNDYGYGVRQAVQFDYINGQQGWGLFNPLRSRDASDWQFARFEETAILSKLESYLKQLVMDFPAHDDIPQIECMLFPADPANRRTMMFDYGLTGFGTPGMILLQVWPTATNMGRLEPILARFLVHSLRQAYFPGFSTLADTLVTEGLAAAYIQQRFPEIKLSWAVSFQRPVDWEEALSQIAAWSDKPHYSQIEDNTYGNVQPFGDTFAPLPQPMDADERQYTIDIIRMSLDSDNANTIAAHLYGDELISAQGHPAFGLPDYAGFEVAYHIVTTYLQQPGRMLTDALAAPTAEIITVVDEL